MKKVLLYNDERYGVSNHRQFVQQPVQAINRKHESPVFPAHL